MNKTPYKKILNYYWEAKTKYSVHSPFVFDFVNEILIKKPNDPILKILEEKRISFIKNKESIDFIEYGAGSTSVHGTKRRISDIAKSSLSNIWQCRVMYNMIHHYGPNNIIEIGTSLGISTAYLYAGNIDSKIITLEGNPSSASLAQTMFDSLDCDDISIEIGEFSNTLHLALEELQVIDAAFIDGNHRKDATIDYFQLIKKRVKSTSFIIIDDIYWSQGMNEAWQEIIEDDSVAFSIDLFRMGIVFFDHSIMEKQHFKLIDSKLKLWSIGVFG